MLLRIRQSLSRVTSSGRFIPTIDGLRFAAIAAVVLYHLNDYVVRKNPQLDQTLLQDDWLFRSLDVGGCGVKLFFAISGFILALPFAEHHLNGARPVALRRYYLRRVTRLEPPYLVNLIVAASLLFVVKGMPLTELAPHLGASMLYLHNVAYGQMSTINGVAWSLEIEVQFYIVAPLLAWIFFRCRNVVRRRAWLLAAMAVVIVGKTLSAESVPPRLAMTLPFALDHFLAGFLLADIYLTDWHQQPAPSRLWDLLGTLGWLAVVAVQFHRQTAFLLPLATLLAYVGAFRGRFLSRLFRRPWLVTIGGMCYTIYLYHFFVISFIGRWTLGTGPSDVYLGILLWQAVWILPVVTIASAVLFRLFEQPFMRPSWWASASHRLRPAAASVP